MTHVFISYKHEDLAFAQELALFAQSQRVPIWLDTHIQPGEEWREAIDKAIAEAFAVVVVMTPEARLSEYITYEWAFAMGLRVPVIPVLLRQTTQATQLHPKLEVLQYIDFSRGASMALWLKLIEHLQALQGTQPARPAQQPPTAQSSPPPQTKPLTDEEKLSQSVVNFFTSSPVENPALIFGLAKGIAQRIYVNNEKGVVESVQTQINQLRRNSNNLQYIQQAANLELALALVTGLGLLESIVKQGIFVRMGMPAIPKK